MKMYLLIGILALLTACSSEVSSNEMETITDNDTKPEVELVETFENSLLVEYHSHSMDRGNHDYESLIHNDLVVDVDYSTVERGDVIHFKSPDFTIETNPNFNMPEYYISRVVGLPGETVEIIDGQVFINNQKLDAFYARATYLGWDVDKYRENGFNNNALSEEEFKEDMVPIKIKDTEVFVLSDDWIRSVGSQDFGPIQIVSIKGKVLGYKK